LLQVVRRGTDPEMRLRAHLLVLLNDSFAWNTIVPGDDALLVAQ